MSTDNQAAAPSASNFTFIFHAALDEYKKLTGQNLHTHPFADAFDARHSPDTVLNVFQKQAQAFNSFHKGGNKLMKSLTPTIHILLTLSATLGEGICLPFPPAKAIFTGIRILLAAVKDVVTRYDTLANLFERVHFFLQRLKCYVDIPLTIEMTELLGKVMAQVLHILACSTKIMKESRIKMFLRKLLGWTDIEVALRPLDSLTKAEGLMTAARNLGVTHHVDDNVAVIKEVIRDVHSTANEAKDLTHQVGVSMNVLEDVARNISDDVKVTKDSMDKINRNQCQEKLRTWLSPPSPSINHNIACDIHLDGTATWFTQGSTFKEWKKNDSLLWIRGNPGSGKSVFCSMIIEDIKQARWANSALVAYYYFDFKDAAKRDLRGLLSSLLIQLAVDSVNCWDVLYRLYVNCHDGSDEPSEAALAQCFRDMLDLPRRPLVYIALDALDECSNATGSPSPRKKVLDFVKDVVVCKHPNLRICITSRPEQDIHAALGPLTSTSRRVTLHEEVGQMNDINSYIRTFVHTDEAMRRWRAEDKELVIRTLSERAGGMFRWVYCQLDTLSRCFPPSICRVLNDLPATLDDTYERTLQGIPKEKREHAHRLFQCLVAAIRPLRVEELAEIFAIEFDADPALKLVEDWRPENAEDAVLSACSTLVSIVDDENCKIVQFSHFSVKEFLTSDRFRTSDVTSIHLYHIPLDAAHTTLARACLTVLLQLDERINRKRLLNLPLAFYAAQNWVGHAHFEDVVTRLKDAMERLFDAKRPHLAAWIWIHHVKWENKRTIDDLEEAPPSLEGIPLYYAVCCGFTEFSRHLIVAHQNDVNASCGRYGSPLHAASFKGHLDTARLLLDHGADANSTIGGTPPLWRAYQGRRLDSMRLLLVHGADVDMQGGDFTGTILHHASSMGRTEVVRLLLQHKADVHAKGFVDQTPLHLASMYGSVKAVELLLEYGADMDAKSGISSSAFEFAESLERHDIVQLMLEHRAKKKMNGSPDMSAGCGRAEDSGPFTTTTSTPTKRKEA